MPPRCIFPEDPAFRKNLTTVPSCNEHNLRRSKDDELLRHILVSAPGNNALCLRVLESGVIGAFERRPHIIETFLPNLTGVRAGNIETASFTIDLPRFESSVGAIVRGLVYAETNEKLLSDLTVAWGPLLTSDYTKAPFLEIIQRSERRLPPIGRGANPTIFTYDFQEFRSGASRLCRLRFYEGHPIYVGWHTA